MTREEFNAEEFWDMKHRIDYPELFMPTELAKKYTPFLRKHSVNDVLEIGCGRSGDALYFASLGLRVFSLDVSLVALRELQNRSKMNFFISFLQSDISYGLPFCNQCFDAIYSRLSLHYFSDELTKKVFSEIYRILKNNGCFIMNVKSESENKKRRDCDFESIHNEHPTHFFTVKYAKSLLVNFSDIQVASSKIVSGEKYERDAIEVIAVK
jgi:SAM-dependent methyltransferase